MENQLLAAREIALLAETVRLTVAEAGVGRPYLLLHGGAGTQSMAGLAAALAPTGRAVLPTHPGFDGRARPAWLHRINELAGLYLALLERLDLHDVVVVGNSAGGWIAAEMGLRASPRVAGLVLLNAVGLNPTASTGEIVDPAKLEPAERGTYSFHDPARFGAALMGTGGPAAIAANQQALLTYAGEPFMYDPGLRPRLPALQVPTRVLWGVSDRIVTTNYGRQWAELIPTAQFELVPEAGHFPQVEQLAVVLAHVLAMK